jgi:hypothetical protein
MTISPKAPAIDTSSPPTWAAKVGGVSLTLQHTMSKRTETLHGIKLGHIWCIEAETGLMLPGNVVSVSAAHAKIELPCGEFNITPRSDVEFKPRKSALFFR